MLTLLFAAPSVWDEYRGILAQALAKAGIQARLVQDQTMQQCYQHDNAPPKAVATEIQAREHRLLARMEPKPRAARRATRSSSSRMSTIHARLRSPVSWSVSASARSCVLSP